MLGFGVVVRQRGIAVLEVALVGDEQPGSGSVEIFHRISVVPVSYTHLDVYKRQGDAYRRADACQHHERHAEACTRADAQHVGAGQRIAEPCLHLQAADR